MALNKNIGDPAGNIYSYWRIGQALLGDDAVEIKMYGYINQIIRQTKEPGLIKTANFSLSSYDISQDNIKKFFYLKIKELPEWSDASDI